MIDEVSLPRHSTSDGIRRGHKPGSAGEDFKITAEEERKMKSGSQKDKPDSSPDEPPERFMSENDPVWFMQAWRLICRPPRSKYSSVHLGPSRLRVMLPHADQPGKRRLSHPFHRQDLTLRNPRGHILECCHFQPVSNATEKKLPCVIFCHGSSSCRVDAFQVMPWLLQYNMTLFCFDFAGSGNSEGEYVTLGRHEEEDILTVMNYLLSEASVSSIGLWGKSMGAVAALFRTSKDRRVDACVLDSPFSDFRGVVLETCARSQLQWVPTQAVDFGLSIIAKDVEQRVGVDPRELQPILDAPNCLCSAFFGCAEEDTLVPPSQVRALQEAWGGPSQIMVFEGDHNTERPANFLEKASQFMWETLKAAADADNRIAGAVDALQGKQTPARTKLIKGSHLSGSQEDALLRIAVDSYVEQRYGMDVAIDAFLSLGGNNSKVAANLTSQRHSKSMPGVPVKPRRPETEEWDTVGNSDGGSRLLAESDDEGSV
eukprot:CAMPEP_0197621904 /NCGR_PEP_ID=MMETSP1338-20131121/2330_1 /TAXON_ID=43686 ORGANISM="Pelagodinium beii, Strain RCC1491" /NCGR_SAMPLE_ID=MMETSP1338 /ASSEMBLY_ACC=CAM_ASM_000754 /LENGTH=485 /DNA_ID=CAMNT_0043191479 /DNA_START=65 /DNA_END=1519 /DNA_ORIENTATION=+